jgi:hypothetical protein
LTRSARSSLTGPTPLIISGPADQATKGMSSSPRSSPAQP